MPWIAGAAALGGAALSYFGGQSAQNKTDQRLEAQIAFQDLMSRTAHQREVEDLREAGLNPILSAKYGGASTPPGASAPAENLVAPAVASAQQIRRLAEDIKNIKADTSKKEQEELALKARQTLDATTTVKTAHEALRAHEEVGTAKAIRRQEEQKAEQVEQTGDSVLGRNVNSLRRMLETILENIK